MLKSNKAVITFAVLMILFGITIISHNYFMEKRNKVFEEINFDLFSSSEDIENVEEIEEPEENVDIEVDEVNQEEEEVTEENNTEEEDFNYYIGTLEIPKINLKKGFVDINSPDNRVSKNVTIVYTSDYPNKDKGNFILAAHSGNSYVSYFRYLYKLSIDDIAYVYYNNVKYTYKIVDIYTQPKTGVIGIYRDYSKTTLTLITCTYNDKTTQTIYIAELISKE